MHVTVESSRPAELEADLLALALPAFDPAEWRMPARLEALDRAVGGRIAGALESGDFRGRPDQTLLLYVDGELPARRLLLIGLGAEDAIELDTLRRSAGTVVREAARRKAARAALALPVLRGVRPPAAAQALAEGAVLAAYRFDAYQKPGEDAPGEVESLVIGLERASDLRAARAAARTGVVLAESQNVARDLSNEPPNTLTPAVLARRAQQVAREVGLRSRVLSVAELRRRKMGGILAVGGGSHNTPRLAVLEHNAPGGRGRQRRSTRPTVCIVGKGITFDSGGISIKPGAAMDEMKHDMSGAAAAVGALRACALLRVPLHVVGIVAAAENLPSGTAYRPGDIVRAMSGKTIEVLNTDAEGRVVLADALHFARTEYEPVAMLDLATLTGACVVALGSWATGLFGRHEGLVEHLRRAGEATGERAWPMPLWKEHGQAIKSQVADIKNVGGREAGASTAAAFLEAFVGDTPWVHLDIAGTAWTSKPGPHQGHGATGVGVRLVCEALRSWRERRPV